MKKTKYITALDISDSKIAGLTACSDSNSKIEVLAHHSVKKKCLRNGLVTDIAQTAQAINEFISQLNEKYRIKSPILSINISGEHLRLDKAEAAVLISNPRGIISTSEIRNLIHQAHIQGTSLDRVALETMVSRYIADDNIEVDNPLRMHARKLFVELMMISGLANNVNNLKKVISQAGFAVSDIVVDILADNIAVLSKENSEDNFAIVNIGSSLTQIAVYRSSRIDFFKIIKSAGNKITEAISKSLNVSFEYAEELKKRYGCEYLITEDKQDVVLRADDGSFNTIDKSLITKATAKGLLEVFNEVNEALKSRGLSVNSLDRIILTGGSALMDSIIETLQKSFKVAITVGQPKGFNVANELISPQWATCLGVAKRSLIEPAYVPKHKKPSSTNYILEKFRDFLTDYF
jgi:cell division protein FtsA